MSPTIVLDRGGKLLLVAGSRGGPRIISSTSQVILNVLDYHMTLADAMSAPRLHHQALPDSLAIERDPLNSPVVFLNLLDQLDVAGDKELLARAWLQMVHRTWGKLELKRPGARDATTATATLPPGSLQRMVRPRCL